MSSCYKATMEKASKQDYSLTCLQCSKSFLSFSSRRRHGREKHEGKMFSCDVCKKDMVPSSKHYHLKNCQVKSPHVVAQKQCDSCGKFFWRIDRHSCTATKVIFSKVSKWWIVKESTKKVFPKEQCKKISNLVAGVA